MSSLEIFLNRKQPEYLNRLAELLSTKNLIETAKPLSSEDVDDNRIKKRCPGLTHKATIYFSGLAGLTLFGRDEKGVSPNKCADTFHYLLENGVKQLNAKGVFLEIRLLFAYPYSNFMYDVLYLEKYDHKYLSTQAIYNNDKYDYSFECEPKLSLNNIENSQTVIHLSRTLRFVQNTIKEGNQHWNRLHNESGWPNMLIVKFCPISILCCMLRINNVVFLDPYIYSKENSDSEEMALKTPISCLEIPIIGSERNTKAEKTKELQFSSVISHFKYLWKHPLTLYAADATKYKRFKKGLDQIKKPSEVSYEKKGNRIERLIRDSSKPNIPPDLKAQTDNWKQFAKSEFLLNCSKVLVESEKEVEDRKISPINIFIIGSWPNGKKHECMKWYQNWINKHLSINNNDGLQLKPIILEVANGQKFLPKLYQQLNISQLGLIIQASDLHSDKNDYFSKPNVYFEKGYLMGKLRKRHERISREESEAVFVFKQSTVGMETDNLQIGYTSFEDNDHCKSQVFAFIYWLWQVTTLNNTYALELMDKVRENVILKDIDTYEYYRSQIEAQVRF